MRGSLTWDRGIEMTRHEDFSRATGVPVFFCDAYSESAPRECAPPSGGLNTFRPRCAAGAAC